LQTWRVGEHVQAENRGGEGVRVLGDHRVTGEHARGGDVQKPRVRAPRVPQQCERSEHERRRERMREKDRRVRQEQRSRTECHRAERSVAGLDPLRDHAEDGEQEDDRQHRADEAERPERARRVAGDVHPGCLEHRVERHGEKREPGRLVGVEPPVDLHQIPRREVAEFLEALLDARRAVFERLDEGVLRVRRASPALHRPRVCRREQQDRQDPQPACH
jgi:hypothetical protein